MIKTIKKYFLIFLCSLFLALPLHAEKIVNKVIAVVGDETILSSELNKLYESIVDQYKKLNPDILKNQGDKKVKQRILEQMIDEKVLLQEAKRKKITVSRRKRELAFGEVKKRFKTEQAFKKELKKLNITEEKFKEKITNQLLIMDLIDKEIRSKVEPPSDEAAKKYYVQHEDEMIEPDAVRIRHILIKTDKKNAKKNKEALKKIKTIKAKLDKKKGLNFADLAKKYSEDVLTAKRGGDIGLFMKGQMSKEFENAAFKLNVGQISDIVKTKHGYHILRCEEKRLAQKKSFEEVKNYIKQYLYQKEIDEKIKEFLKKVKSKTNIVINDI
jgi:parvulin-like peptidyl-prolyl isomerase